MPWLISRTSSRAMTPPTCWSSTRCPGNAPSAARFRKTCSSRAGWATIRLPAATSSGAWRSPPTFGRARAETDFHGGMGWLLKPTTVPAFGYTVVGWDALTSMTEAAESDDAIIENDRYRITFDTQKGGITSLFDKQLNYEWVDASAGLSAARICPRRSRRSRNARAAQTALHRQLDRPPPKPSAAGIPIGKPTAPRPRRVLMHKIYRLSFGTVVEQILEHAMIGKICQRVFLPDARRPDRVPVRMADGHNHPSRSHLSALPVQPSQRPGAF